MDLWWVTGSDFHSRKKGAMKIAAYREWVVRNNGLVPRWIIEDGLPVFTSERIESFYVYRGNLVRLIAVLSGGRKYKYRDDDGNDKVITLDFDYYVKWLEDNVMPAVVLVEAGR